MAEKKFWLGKGTLGKVRTGEEIPAGMLSDERLRALEKQNLIGARIVSVVDQETPEQAELADLRAENSELKKQLKAADKALKTAEKKLAEIDKLADDDDKGKGKKK